FPADPVTCLLLLLYSPIGLCLLLLRLFIGAHVFLVSCVLPESAIRRLLLRVMSSVLGVMVVSSDRCDVSSKIYISNHRTHFDHNAISLLTSCSSSSVSCPPGFLCWARGYLEAGSPGSRSQLLESLKHFLSQPSSRPLLLFPEEETTNGRAGLLHFSSWPFSLSDCVQPLTLRVTRPFICPVSCRWLLPLYPPPLLMNTDDVSPPIAVAGSSWLVELLWTLYIPYTVYHVRWLPPVSRIPRESDEDFASRVQKILGSSLGVCSTSHTAADHAEYVKRRAMDPPHRTRRPPSVSPAEDDMARRVKEVLPQVPLSAIHKDL
ncbi:lipid droplet-regulating VLDL assembly factor AUP1, partial [Mantella aurantiaca]